MTLFKNIFVKFETFAVCKVAKDNLNKQMETYFTDVEQCFGDVSTVRA